MTVARPKISGTKMPCASLRTDLEARYQQVGLAGFKQGIQSRPRYDRKFKTAAILAAGGAQYVRVDAADGLTVDDHALADRRNRDVDRAGTGCLRVQRHKRE